MLTATPIPIPLTPLVNDLTDISLSELVENRTSPVAVRLPAKLMFASASMIPSDAPRNRDVGEAEARDFVRASAVKFFASMVVRLPMSTVAWVVTSA